MSSRLSRAGRALLLLNVLSAAACQAPACKQDPVAILPLLNEPTGLYVPLVIDGQPVKFLLDTGSAQSLLTSETVGRLGLRTERLLDDTDVLIGFAIEGIGGRRHIDRAWPHSIELGQAHLLGVAVSYVWSRNTQWDPSADGILGMDILSRYDLDVDVGGGRLALFEPGSLCPPQAEARASTTTLSQDLAAFGPRLTARIGNQAFDTLLDTGAQRSSIMARAASRLALEKQPHGERFSVFGVGTGHADAVMQRFHSLSLNGIVLRNVQLAVVAAPGPGGLEIILGTDVLAHVHLWLSASRRRLTLAEIPAQDAEKKPPL